MPEYKLKQSGEFQGLAYWNKANSIMDVHLRVLQLVPLKRVLFVSTNTCGKAAPIYHCNVYCCTRDSKIASSMSRLFNPQNSHAPISLSPRTNHRCIISSLVKASYYLESNVSCCLPHRTFTRNKKQQNKNGKIEIIFLLIS